MALTRPPDVVCGSFAALGPQLQQLATAADEVMCDMSSAAIMAGMDAPAYVAAHAGGLTVPGNGVDYSAGLSFSSPAQYYNNPPLVGPIRVVGGSNAPYIVALPERAWWYLGVWVQTNPSPSVSTRWKMRISVDDTDPSTGLIVTSRFYRHWRNNFAAAVGGNEMFHFDLLYPTGGGNIDVALKQNSGGNISTVNGRIWLTRMSITR